MSQFHQRSNPVGGELEDGEAQVEMLTFGVDSIGGAIQEDVEVFVTQQRGFRSRGFNGVYLSIKNASGGTTSLSTTTSRSISVLNSRTKTCEKSYCKLCRSKIRQGDAARSCSLHPIELVSRDNLG